MKETYPKSIPSDSSSSIKNYNKGTLLFSNSIIAGDIADESIGFDDEDYITEEEFDDDLIDESDREVHTDEERPLQEVGMVALQIKRLI